MESKNIGHRDQDPLEWTTFDFGRAKKLFDFTDAEAQVAYYQSIGMTRQEIALKRVTTDNTIKSEVKGMYKKVRSQSNVNIIKSGLATLFVREGLLTIKKKES